jgi:hypothetical protein
MTIALVDQYGPEMASKLLANVAISDYANAEFGTVSKDIDYSEVYKLRNEIRKHLKIQPDDNSRKSSVEFSNAIFDEIKR